MVFTRKNVWQLGDTWADPILWYARGVKAMKARALNDPTGWRFFGAIHGIDRTLWTRLGYLSEQDHMPSKHDLQTYWNQCQHGSWYFLPWHRGYLLALEAVIRDAVVQAGGPKDWALPYWNYFKPDQNKLPPAFASKDWPDGTGDNPLFVEQRYGPDNNGTVFVPMDQVDENALGDARFVGGADGGSPGFGGVNTGFSHGGNIHGGIETQPHDMVHGLVGGGNPDTNLPGLMSDPDTAGLDPIFYLHHANIDRLWEVWNETPTSTGDPTASKWVKGPASIGEHAFVLPMPGGKSWTYTPGEMKSLSELGYQYDDVSSPFAKPQMVKRLERLGVAVAAADVRSAAMAEPKSTELIGASGSLRVTGSDIRASVALDRSVQSKVTSSLKGFAAAPTQSAPDRVFLNLENVRGLSDATTFNVYINVPDGDDPAQHPELKAGSIALFGMRKASAADDKHAGDGLTFVLEITRIIDALHLAGTLSPDQLHVRLVPRQPVPDAAQISIGRISVFRQSP
ncbi:tyrosinase family protein [Bradyrhizobium sp. HKCCYLS1011]|uniref:tyrosinase family protein n=1 Tax=Bradyrhizobium sp. HKCCYLS1011 TaxID=3420733 RepID=UPI003EBB59E9